MSLSLRLRRRVSLVAAVVLLSTGCTGWRAETKPLPEYLTAEQPEVIRVTRSDESKVDIYDPRIVGNDLQGLPTRQAVNGISIPLRDVRAFGTKHVSLTKSLLYGLIGVGAIVAWDLLQSLNQQPGY